METLTAPKIRTCRPRPAGRCRWCGRLLAGRRRAWCSEQCEQTWQMNHVWAAARAEALRRVEVRSDRGGLLGWLCAGCGDLVAPPDWINTRGHTVEVNHRVPVQGERTSGCRHHQDGLEVLCLPCHRDVTRAQRSAGWQPVALPPIQGRLL